MGCTVSFSLRKEVTMKVRTVEGLFGQLNHYNENGEKIGESVRGLVGGSWDHYDKQGNYSGYSDVGLFTDYNHYNRENNRMASSISDCFGGYDHYDNNGYAGHSTRSLFGYDSDIDLDF